MTVAWRAVAEVVLRSKSVLTCARDPACSWDMVNDAVLSRGLGHLVGDERRFDGARMMGVDEHVWRHAPRGGRYVTVAVDPTPRRDGRPARLLDVVEGRSGRAFADWLAAHRQAEGKGRRDPGGPGERAAAPRARRLQRLPRTLRPGARTMKKRMRDILAFFDWDNNANGPTEAINARLETLRGIALGFTNLGNYVTRSLLHAGGFRQAIQPHLR